MNISVKLECELKNLVAVFEHQTAVMIAFQMIHDYFASKDVLIGTGPELYAEQWLCNFTTHSHNEFGNLLVTYFGKILWAVSHVRGDEDGRSEHYCT